MSTIDYLEKFIAELTNLLHDILKRRGIRRKALVDVLVRSVQSKLIDKDIEHKKDKLKMLDLQHKITENNNAAETIERLKSQRDELQLEKKQWLKLRGMYAKRLDALDQELTELQRKHPEKSTNDTRESIN